MTNATAVTDSISSNEHAEFDIVTEYLLRCPHVASVRDNPAIKAAIDGIEKEKTRRIRDSKLRHKFSGKRNAAAVSYGSKSNSKHYEEFNSCDLTDREDIVVVEKDDIDMNNITARMEAEEQDKEWQDVLQKDNISLECNIDQPFGIEGISDGSSYLGRSLSKACVDAIAERNHINRVVVSSPLAAVSVALHAALRSLDFACTGVPEKGLSKKGGFASPIRELDKNQFLPYRWDDENSNATTESSIISLRYRNKDMGAVVLNVEFNNDGCHNSNENVSDTKETTVQVTLVPANNKDSIPDQALSFLLSEHINLDSWNTAMLKESKAKASKNHVGKIAPILHYKNLSGLMSKFCQTFDIGANNDDEPNFIPAVKCTEQYPSHQLTRVAAPQDVSWKAGRVPSTFDQAFLKRNPMHGDFSSDILPGGLSGGVGVGGNLMGPNHPLFSPYDNGRGQGMGGGFGFGGPGTMQPRFDPVLPPFVDGNINGNGPATSRRPQKKPSRTGDPNPDHLPPPNSLSEYDHDHMFM